MASCRPGSLVSSCNTDSFVFAAIVRLYLPIGCIKTCCISCRPHAHAPAQYACAASLRVHPRLKVRRGQQGTHAPSGAGTQRETIGLPTCLLIYCRAQADDVICSRYQPADGAAAPPKTGIPTPVHAPTDAYVAATRFGTSRRVDRWPRIAVPTLSRGERRATVSIADDLSCPAKQVPSTTAAAARQAATAPWTSTLR